MQAPRGSRSPDATSIVRLAASFPASAKSMSASWSRLVSISRRPSSTVAMSFSSLTVRSAAASAEPPPPASGPAASSSLPVMGLARRSAAASALCTVRFSPAEPETWNPKPQPGRPRGRSLPASARLPPAICSGTPAQGSRREAGCES